MSDALETINQSMQQTKDCQKMTRECIGYLELLIDEVKRLKAENEELKNKLKQNK